MSPTQLSLRWCKQNGFEAVVVEKWNPWAKRRQDLWGADILARRGSEPLLAIQATTKANMAARLKKTAQDRRRWLDSGNFFLVHGWKKKKTRYELTSR